MRKTLLTVGLFTLTGILSVYSSTIQNYGHRGCKGLMPENTIPAYQKAMELGVDFVDMDVNMTKGGVVVVTHDSYLNPDFTKDANGNWLNSDKKIYVKDLNFAELEKYTVGEAKPGTKRASIFKDEKNIPNINIPTITDCIKYVKKWNAEHDTNIKINIEMKTYPFGIAHSTPSLKMAKAVYKIIKEEGITDTVEKFVNLERKFCMIYTEGILLGLSTGTVCLAYCGPVLVPFLLAEHKKISRNTVYVILFLLGRLVAYIITGFIVGIIGSSFLQYIDFSFNMRGIIYTLLALLLIVYGFYRFNEICLGKVQNKVSTKFGERFSLTVPVIGGLVTGLNICPPFLMAVAKASETGNISASIYFFLMFFIGTSLFFIPLPFIGLFRRQKTLRIIGKFASVIAGFFYLYQGIILIIK